MFVSKLLNKLFFNTNNDCCFTTLLNLNQFMLTKDNYKKILDVEPIKPDGGFSEPRSGIEKPRSSIDVTDRRSVKSTDDELNNSIESSEGFTPDENSSLLYIVEKSDDDELLKRKNEFQNEQRCITPVPFTLPDQTHPVTKSPSELVVGIQRIPDQRCSL